MIRRERIKRLQKAMVSELPTIAFYNNGEYETNTGKYTDTADIPRNIEKPLIVFEGMKLPD